MVDVHVAMRAPVVVVMVSSCAVRGDMSSIVVLVEICVMVEICDGLFDDNFLVNLVNWLHDLYRSFSAMDGA